MLHTLSPLHIFDLRQNESAGLEYHPILHFGLDSHIKTFIFFSLSLIKTEPSSYIILLNKKMVGNGASLQW
jgi:hypothetical protein